MSHERKEPNSIMSLLPIVERELRIHSRRWQTYFGRMIGAGLGMLLLMFLLYSMRRMRGSEVGVMIFNFMTWSTYLFALATGGRATSDSVSSEKRDGTLGLLFLTPLKGFDVVLGKLVSGSLGAVYTLLAFLPMMAIPLLMGGVTWDLFWHVVLMLFATLFLTVCVGMLASCAFYKDQVAALVTFLGSTLLALVPVIFFMVAEWVDNDAILDSSSPPAWIYFLSPSWGLVASFPWSAGMGSPGTVYGSSLMGSLMLSLVCIGWASWLLPRRWQTKAESAQQASWRKLFKQWTQGDRSLRDQSRSRMLDENAVFWRCSRSRLDVSLPWVFIAVVFLAVGILFGAYGEEVLSEGTFMMVSLTFHMGIKIWMAGAAARTFCEDRNSGALELLLGTSLTVQEILEGKFRSLRRTFMMPVCFFLLLDFIFMFQGPDESEWYMWWMIFMILLPVDLLAISWLGMWRGLNATRVAKASSAVHSRILIFPMIFMAFLTMAIGGTGGMQFEGVLILWVVLCSFVDLFFIFKSRESLNNELRTLGCTRVVDSRASFWARFFKSKGEAAS